MGYQTPFEQAKQLGVKLEEGCVTKQAVMAAVMKRCRQIFDEFGVEVDTEFMRNGTLTKVMSLNYKTGFMGLRARNAKRSTSAQISSIAFCFKNGTNTLVDNK